MTSRAGSSHVGSCLSVADVMAVLFADVLRFDSSRPGWSDRDRFIMSKGHAAAVTYAALAESGFLTLEQLETYGLNGSQLFGHITRAGVAGVELSTGSLGHGLPVGGGMALAGKRRGEGWRVFVVMSDGELDEGSNWEAILFAAHHKLDNLVAVIDYNGIQSLDTVASTLALEPIGDKFAAFGWSVADVDGHDIDALRSALEAIPKQPGKPTVVIARTVKGKGVSFMENKVLWHYRSASGEELEKALAEVESGG
jgi:transketolase